MDPRKRRRDRKSPTFPMRVTRRKIDEISTQLTQLKPKLGAEDRARADSLLQQIASWPRFAAGVSKERREEIRLQGGEIIAEYNFFFTN